MRDHRGVHSPSTVPPLNAAVCLDEFFVDRRRGAVGQRLARIERAERSLRTAVERTAELVLTDEEQVLAAMERSFEPEGAVERILPASGLLLVLEAHLAHLELSPRRTAARRVELEVCGALSRYLARELRHLDVEPATHRIEVALAECVAGLSRPARGRSLLRALGLS